METLTLPNTASTTSMQVHVHLDEDSPTLEEQQQHHHLVSLGDMAELTQEDIVSIPKEIMLISLVSQEQALYNPKHEHYRNTHRKDAKWVEIAENVGWSEMQCKSKWKAMRDQYCRELKRSKFNAKANVKWKYFKELEFLRPFALSRNYRPRATVGISKNNLSTYNSSGNNSNNKLPCIKIENAHFASCEFATDGNVLDTDDKHESTTARLLTSLTDEQLNTVMQQNGGWNYLTTSTTAAETNVRNLQNNQHNSNELDDNLLQQSQPQAGADDMLCALVESVAAAAAAGEMQQQQPHNTEEEDDDPIHTFLNMESFFEKDLIGMIQQEDILYNSFHPNYRNAKFKLEVWDEIARKLKKPVRRCRLKWKALRDQYIREHKRLKDRENSESLPRWKHYDTLCFLQKFIKHKTNEFDSKNMIQITKTEIDTDIEENMIDTSPLRSPAEVTVVANEMQPQTLPTLSGPHTQHHQPQHQLNSAAHEQHNICVVSGSSIRGYDEMDIDHYIIGHTSDTGANEDGTGMDADDDDEDRKSHQHFPDYAPNSTSDTTLNDISSQHTNCNELPTEDEMEYKDVKANKAITQPDVGVLQQQQQLQPQHQLVKLTSQCTHQQQPHTQQHQLLPLEVGAETHPAALSTNEESLMQHQPQQQQLQQPQHHQQHDFNNDMQQQLLNSGTANLTSSNVANVLGGNSNITVMNTSASLNMNGINVGVLKSSAVCSTLPSATTTITTSTSPISAATATASIVANSVTGKVGDDEVGAFFSAIAMKIRNAKMSPVAFTDLQIDILRVINETLRNH